MFKKVFELLTQEAKSYKLRLPSTYFLCNRIFIWNIQTYVDKAKMSYSFFQQEYLILYTILGNSPTK